MGNNAPSSSSSWNSNVPNVSNFYNYPQPRRREEYQQQQFPPSNSRNPNPNANTYNQNYDQQQYQNSYPQYQQRPSQGVPQMRQQNVPPQQQYRQPNIQQQQQYQQPSSQRVPSVPPQQQPHPSFHPRPAQHQAPPSNSNSNYQYQYPSSSNHYQGQQNSSQPRHTTNSSSSQRPQQESHQNQQQHTQRPFRPHPSVAKEKIVTSTDAIENLPVVKYTVQREELMQHCFDSCTCSICIDDFQYEDNLIMLPCQHIFHSDCVKPWLKQHSNSCPVCRFELEVVDFQMNQARKVRMIERFSEGGLKIIEMQSDIEVTLEKVYQIQKIFEQKQHIENLHKEDILDMNKELDHFDTFLENKTFALDNVSQLSEKLREQKKYCIRKIQGIQKYISQLKIQINQSLL